MTDKLRDQMLAAALRAVEECAEAIAPYEPQQAQHLFDNASRIAEEAVLAVLADEQEQNGVAGQADTALGDVAGKARAGMPAAESVSTVPAAPPASAAEGADYEGYFLAVRALAALAKDKAWP